MVFTDQIFLIFAAITLILYYATSSHVRAQNLVLLSANLIFYGYWSRLFLGLMLLSIATDYCMGLKIAATENPRARKAWLLVSVCVNLGILFTFKYYNFFSAELQQALAALHITFTPWVMHLILPLGISFYIFQTLGYTIDVYRRHTEPERNLITFAVFVTYFPQLVAGPIEKCYHLLPQIKAPRTLDLQMVKEGCWMLCWGYFIKLVIADSAAPFVDFAFDADKHNLMLTLLGTLLFGLQIYADFFGYSLIALGISRLLGITLTWNFNAPYFSLTLRDFWRRWHITLGRWFRDYVYIPLGGNRCSAARTAINLGIVMLLVGLWHGASWGYIAWGVLHGTWLAVEHMLYKRIAFPKALTWLITMMVVFIGWLIFRGQSLSLVIAMLDFQQYHWDRSCNYFLGALLVLATPVMAIDAYNTRHADQLRVAKLSTATYALICGAMLSLVWVMANQGRDSFIYFQF